jgi:ketosteroid isomerase-like protein
MSAPTNTDRVKEIYAAFGRGDIQAILGALHPDVAWTVQGPALVPIFGKRKGRQQVAQFFQTVAEKLTFQEFGPREFIAQGDRVVVLGVERGQAKPTSRPVEGEWAHVFTFKNGQVVDFREYCNTAAFAEAFQTSAKAVA